MASHNESDMELKTKPHIRESDRDIELMRKIIDCLDRLGIASSMITGNLLAVAWGILESEVNRKIDEMYDNVRSFNYDPYMNIIITDYEAFINGVSTDPKSPLVRKNLADHTSSVDDMNHNDKEKRRLLQYDWSDFIRTNDRMLIMMEEYKPEFVKVSTRKDRIKLYFEHRFIEKALLRLSMGEMDEKELEESRTIYKGLLLLLPNPF